MPPFLRDLQQAARSLRRQPGFTATAVLSLGLGIGASTAMFTVVNGVLLRPLPYPEADRVVSVWTRYLPSSGYDFPQFPVSGPELMDYRAQTRALSEVAAFRLAGATLATGSAGDEPQRVVLAAGTANLFATLGVQAAMGRTFLAGEDGPGAPCVAVLSQGLWAEAFGGDPDAVGRLVRVEGFPCEIVGVMPAGFVFPDARARMWRNLILDPADPAWGRYSHNLQAIGRLAPGVGFAEAEEEARSLMAGWAEAFPDHYASGHFVFLRPFLDDVVGDVRARLLALLGAVGIVLLIVCANLGNLLLARGEGRRRELAVRRALGAGRRRLMGHLLAESAVLAFAGGALGVGVAVLSLDGLLALYPGALPRAEAVAIDWRVLGFATAASALTAVLFGLLPAVRAASAAPEDALRAEGRGATGHVRGTRLRRGLVVAEMALSVTLVVGAGLLLRTYGHLRRVDLGLEPERVYVLSLALPSSAYATNADVRAFYAPLPERLTALPGVESVGAVSNLPLVAGWGGLDDFLVEGRPEPGPGQQRWNAGYVLATPGYFETLGIPVVSGRAFEPGDRRDAPWVAVINREAARRYWPNEDPVGRRLRYLSSPDTTLPPEWITIVGVVENTRAEGAQADPRPQVFVPHAQMPRESYPGRFMTLVVRAAVDAPAVAPDLRAAVRDADRNLAVLGSRPMDEIVSESLGQPRFTSLLVTFFGTVAMLLGALGIHGLLAYTVAQRSRELGIRLALGARPEEVLGLVVGQGMKLALLGVALGVAGALAATRLIDGLLFGVGTADPVSFGVAIAVLGSAALMACYVPGRRAARIDPMSALRSD